MALLPLLTMLPWWLPEEHVGLVHDEHLTVLGVADALAREIQDPPGRGHDDVHLDVEPHDVHQLDRPPATSGSAAVTATLLPPRSPEAERA